MRELTERIAQLAHAWIDDGRLGLFQNNRARIARRGLAARLWIGALVARSRDVPRRLERPSHDWRERGCQLAARESRLQDARRRAAGDRRRQGANLVAADRDADRHRRL